MSNDVQAHEEVDAHADGANRRGGVRHAAESLGAVTARIIGGSQVELVNFSSRGILFECDSRLLIGARASVRITTADANLIVTGRVVRSRVKGLVNGALRYDAALVLDSELPLSPAILAAVPAVSDDVSFESAFEDPSPVEAYVAESEASLLEVTTNSGLPLHAMASVAAEREAAISVGPADLGIEPTAHAAGEADPALDQAVEFETNAVVETDAAIELEAVAFETNAVPEPEAVAIETDPVVSETEASAVDAEPVAFEPDADIAFEPSGDFLFEEAEPAGGLVIVAEAVPAEEPTGAPMFDSTYIPPVYETESAESQFEATPPMPAPEQATSSFFDARPSESFGETEPIGTAASNAAPTEAAVLVSAPTLAEAVAVAPQAETVEHVDFESEVAFEAEDGVMFEASFDDAPAESIDVTVSVAIEPVPVMDAATEPVLDLDPAVADPVADAAADDDGEALAAVAPTEDRVLLQFAATVPHDLADLRRIAADNQW